MRVECVNNESSDLKGINVGDKFEIKKKITDSVYVYDYIEGPEGIIDVDTENYYFKKSFKFI